MIIHVRNKRVILFSYTEDVEKLLKFSGIYKLKNTLNGKFYIGSSKNLKSRLKDHCAVYNKYKRGELKRISHPILWKAFDKYDISKFSIEILEVFETFNHEVLLEREEFYIKTLNPAYNVSKEPTKGGKPNKGKKLSDKWKENIKEKSSQYKHSEESLQKVKINNALNSVRLIFKKDLEILNFESWVEASKYFQTSPSCVLNAYMRSKKYKNWEIEKLSTQSKKIKLFIEDEEIIFKSYNECDRYLDMWRGYTSTFLLSCDKNSLLKDKYKFELI